MTVTNFDVVGMNVKQKRVLVCDFGPYGRKNIISLITDQYTNDIFSIEETSDRRVRIRSQCVYKEEGQPITSKYSEGYMTHHFNLYVLCLATLCIT